MISMEDSCRDFAYSKNEEIGLKIFQFSERWDPVEKRTFLLKTIPLTENFSTEKQHQQDPSRASHIRGPLTFSPPGGAPGGKVPRAGCGRRAGHAGEAARGRCRGFVTLRLSRLLPSC